MIVVMHLEDPSGELLNSVEKWRRRRSRASRPGNVLKRDPTAFAAFEAAKLIPYARCWDEDGASVGVAGYHICEVDGKTYLF
jgi:hypothetical protein